MNYTEVTPDNPCETCVQFLLYMCCNYDIKCQRKGVMWVYPGYAMVPTYANPYPECQYHRTADQIKAEIDTGEDTR